MEAELEKEWNESIKYYIISDIRNIWTGTGRRKREDVSAGMIWDIFWMWPDWR